MLAGETDVGPSPRPGLGLLTLAARSCHRYNKSMRTFILLLSLLLGTFPVFAQKLPAKQLVRSLLETPKPAKVTETLKHVPSSVRVPVAVPHTVTPPAAALVQQDRTAQTAAQIERLAAEKMMTLRAPVAPKEPALQETEKHIRESLVEVVGRSGGELMGSGFVVRSSSGKLYAVVSYHVVGRAGNTVAVRLYDATGKPVVYTGVVNAAGSFGLNAPDAAIIELPAAAAAHARPLKVAPHAVSVEDELVVWGTPYVAEGFARVDELKVKLVQSLKIVMDSPDVSDDFNGLCGSPLLDSRGYVAGIYSGHDPSKGLVFAVNARKTLEWLIVNYENKMTPFMPFKLYGRQILQIGPEETVGWVYHFDSYGTLLHKVYLPKYAGEFDPEHTELLFPDVRHGDFLEFEIVKHRAVERTISVNIS